MIITKNMWEDFAHTISLEAIGDEFGTTPVGGATEGDKDMNESNEQNNDSVLDEGFGNDFGGSDFGMGDDMGGFGDSSGMGDMNGGMGGNSGLGTALDPTKHPFQGQNGRALLDTKLSELYTSVNHSLELSQANIKIDKVVVGELTSLLKNIEQVREVVFIQPVETSLYRWSLCVKAYELICKQLCIDTEQEKNNSK
jgi:hypothetical protein